MTALVRELLNLSADPFPPHSRAIDSSQPNKRQLALDGGCIKYYLYSGDVYIEKLEHGNSFQSLRASSGSGLYRAMWDTDDRSWETAKIPSFNTNVQIGEAHCAAISGRQFSKSEEAASSLSVHIQKAFTIRKGEMEALDKHYSLYFVKKGEHKSDIRSREVSSLIELAAKRGASVNWLVQGEGSEVMLGALKDLKRTPLSDSIKSQLGKQKLFFSNHTASIRELEKLINELGLSKDSKWYNSAPLDLFAGGVRNNNLIAEIVMAGEKAAQDARANNESVVGAHARNVSKRVLNTPVAATAIGGYAMAKMYGQFGSDMYAQFGSEALGVGVGAAAVAFATLKKGPGMMDAIKTLLALANGSGRGVWYDNNEQFARDVRRARAVA